MRPIFPAMAALLLLPCMAFATVSGSARGLVHDPQHRPTQGALITIRSTGSDWQQTATTDENGDFQFSSIPIGEYTVTVTAPGFSESRQNVVIFAGSASNLHFQLALAAAREEVQVSASPDAVDTESSAAPGFVTRAQISRTPGAEDSNSMAMITDYVPSAVMVHDQLHVRGGHQVEWLIDGVPVPDANIGGNVGPRFDPKDIDTIEMQRGGYSAEFGDRTYGVFNVVTRSGFERNRTAEIVVSYGSYYTTNDQINFGDHSDRFAYYGSVNGNRSNLGLETPSTSVLHDLEGGGGAFTSLIFNATPADQLRLVSSVRADHYQVPNSPDDQASGIRDVERERDALLNFSWVHKASHGLVLTFSPFYHYNRADYEGGLSDNPLIPRDDRTSNYFGGLANLAFLSAKHNARAGVQLTGQRDQNLFALTATDGSGLALRETHSTNANAEATYFEDQYKISSWLTLNGGVRLTRFNAGASETSIDPRAGAALRIPRLGWVLRAFYGRYYQAPPLTTVQGPLQQFAISQGFGFLPLHGERDEQHEFGLSIPFRGWSVDLSHFRTGARNFFDHIPLGNSSIFLPVTIESARIRGWEATVRSPRIFDRGEVHLAYSHMYVEGQGGLSGGLTDFAPPGRNYFFLDHDQRETLVTGFTFDAPRRSWLSGNLTFGSGFVNGNGPDHLPAHATFDLVLGKQFGENWTIQLTALNLANTRYLLDTSNTFGGTHFADPRRLSMQLKYKFRY